jgi:hypothetical protein
VSAAQLNSACARCQLRSWDYLSSSSAALRLHQSTRSARELCAQLGPTLSAHWIRICPHGHNVLRSWDYSCQLRCAAHGRAAEAVGCAGLCSWALGGRHSALALQWQAGLASGVARYQLGHRDATGAALLRRELLDQGAGSGCAASNMAASAGARIRQLGARGRCCRAGSAHQQLEQGRRRFADHGLPALQLRAWGCGAEHGGDQQNASSDGDGRAQQAQCVRTAETRLGTKDCSASTRRALARNELEALQSGIPPAGGDRAQSTARLCGIDCGGHWAVWYRLRWGNWPCGIGSARLRCKLHRGMSYSAAHARHYQLRNTGTAR